MAVSAGALSAFESALPVGPLDTDWSPSTSRPLRTRGFTQIQLGPGGESPLEALGLDLLRGPADQLRLATPRRGPRLQSRTLAF